MAIFLSIDLLGAGGVADGGEAAASVGAARIWGRGRGDGDRVCRWMMGTPGIVSDKLSARKSRSREKEMPMDLLIARISRSRPSVYAS
jgi:hypothetical protein